MSFKQIDYQNIAVENLLPKTEDLFRKGQVNSSCI